MTSVAKQVGNYVKYKISRLSESKNDSATKATLAKLRRGIGKAPGSIPELWETTMEGLPEALAGNGEMPSYGEWAVHTALTLFSMHQQGKDIKKQCMSKDGEYLGIAVKKLITSEGGNEETIKRRFDIAATSDSLEELSHHLRGLVQLMKAKDIPLDYPELAMDLYRFQFSDAKSSVRLNWGRGFYRFREDSNQKENN